MSELVVSKLMQSHICGAIASGEDPNKLLELIRVDPAAAKQKDPETGRLPLHWAVVQVGGRPQHDYIELIKHLVGAYPEACNVADQIMNATPLYLAANTPP